MEPVIALVTRPGRPTRASRQADQRPSMHRRPTTSASTRARTCGRTVSRSRSLGRLVGLSDASIFTPGAWMSRGVSLDTAAVSQGGKHETDQKIRCSIQAGTWRTSPIAPGSLGSTGNDPMVVHEPLQSSMTTRWLGPMLDPLAFGPTTSWHSTTFPRRVVSGSMWWRPGWPGRADHHDLAQAGGVAAIGIPYRLG